MMNRMKNKPLEACNYYVGDFRAVKINGKWRATRQNPKNSTEWLFLDDIEYDTAAESLRKYLDKESDQCIN